MQFRRVKKIVMLLPAIILVGGGGIFSCSDKEIDISTTGDKGYTDQPIQSFRAQDADGSWIDAEIDEADRNITFRFHSHSTLDQVNCELDVDPKWGTLVFPEERSFTLNLNSAQVITVNDGVDDIRYRVTGEIQEPLLSLRIVVGEDQAQPLSIAPVMHVRMEKERARSALEHAALQMTLENDVVLLSPEDPSDVNLNGAPAEIVIYDKKHNHQKIYTLSVTPAAAVNLDSGGWEDVSVNWAQEHSVELKDHIAIYRTDALHGSSGRIGWAVVVAGSGYDAKLIAKADVESGRSKVSLALHDNPDYNVFIPYQGPSMWRTKADGDNTYISPLVWRDGASARTASFGTRPCVGIKAGKAEIRYAFVADNVLYSSASPKDEPVASDGEPWNVDVAAGGCLMLIQNGQNLIGGEDARSFSTYRSLWVPYPDCHTFITTSWSVWKPLDDYLAQRGGRTAIGCTADGSLVIFQTEMLVNTHNQPQWTSTAESGSTVNEVARELLQMGCTSAALWEENYWNIILMQDGGAYNEGNLWGAEFFHHQRRHYLDATDAHSRGQLADNELENLYVLMIK